MWPWGQWLDTVKEGSCHGELNFYDLFSRMLNQFTTSVDVAKQGGQTPWTQDPKVLNSFLFCCFCWGPGCCFRFFFQAQQCSHDLKFHIYIHSKFWCLCVSSSSQHWNHCTREFVAISESVFCVFLRVVNLFLCVLGGVKGSCDNVPWGWRKEEKLRQSRRWKTYQQMTSSKIMKQ